MNRNDVGDTQAQQDEYAKAMQDNLPQLDERGRKNPAIMTDRELLLELVQSVRFGMDSAEVLLADAKTNPMLAMLFKK